MSQEIIALDDAEIEVGKALSATIAALQSNLTALLLTEQCYINSLRSRRELGDDWVIQYWERGFEHGNKNSQ